MNFEEKRLETFENWPVQTPIPVKSLAKAGFFYSGVGTEVTCFSCGGKISEWNFGDKAIEKHRRFYPNCEYVQNPSSGAANVPYNPNFRASSSSLTPMPNCNGTSINQPSGSSLTNSELFSSPSKQNVRATSAITNQSSVYSGSDTARIYSRPYVNSSEPGNSATPLLNAGAIPMERKVDGTQLDNPYKHESHRLRTFQDKWPLSYISPASLAQAGFYYLQVNDKVQCFYCRGILTNWERGDIPMAEHARNFPLCPFVMGYTNANASTNAWDIPATSHRGRDVCGKYDWEVVYSEAENKQKLLGESKQHLELVKWGIQPHEGPSHISQASKEARLRSFTSWPVNSAVQPIALAEAGFFYIGISDHTKCFYCDGGLCNWEVGDDPWTEHARWFCNCSFLRLNKGEAFIKACLASRNTARTPEREPTAVPPVVSAIHQQVEEVMKTSMLQAFLKTELYPPYIVRKAVLEKVSDTGIGPRNLDELTELIHQVKEQERRMANIDVETPEQTLPLQEMFNVQERIIPSTEMEVEPPEETVQMTSVPTLEPITRGAEAEKPKNMENKTGETCSTLELEEENRLLKESRMCKICMDQEVGVVFLPCGHLIACPHCASALKDCALCRTPIRGTIRTFLS